MTQEVQKATNRKAIEMMKWNMNECIISDLNREEDGKARIWFKENDISLSAIAAEYSYTYHYDEPVDGGEVIPICGTADCVNFLHLSWEPKELIAFREKNRVKRKKASHGNGSVVYRKDRDKYVARMMCDGKRKSLGMFDTEEEAIAAVAAYRKENNLD